ncbi:MFS transporter [Aquamicrobium terrae]|uniref:CP family cyanate transporter-like MFS transporter n=1 Tax=Aquamicrobium terrae TaxID=1324945 RepID=A0ABV2N2V6_9HYPH
MDQTTNKPKTRQVIATSGNETAPVQISFPVALFCIVLVALHLRPGLVSVGPLLSSIQEQFHLSHTVAALLTSIPNLLLGLMAFPAPWLSRRFGRDRTIVGALLILTVSTLCRAFAPNTFTLLATTAGVGVGIAVSQTLVASFVKASYPAKAAVVIGIYATALSAGATLAAGLTEPVIRFFGDDWRYGAGVWSLLGIPAVAAWLFIARRTKTTERRRTIHRFPWRHRKAWAIAIFFGCQNFLFYSVVAWLVPFLIEQGETSALGGFVLAAFTLVFTVSVPVFGTFSKDLDRRGWLAFSAGCTLLGLAALTLLPGLSPFAGVSVAGFGLAGAFTLGMTLPLDNTRDEDEASAWNAFVLMTGYVIASSGPLLVGYLRDQSDDFRLSMLLLLIVALIMLVLSAFLRPRQHA